MIKCTDMKRSYGQTGLVRAVLLSDTTPETFPTTGEDVEGLDDADRLDCGSTIRCLDESKLYILGTDGATWYEWKGGSLGEK